jgi:hypothetical protein
MYILTINVPVVYMGRYEVVLRGDYPSQDSIQIFGEKNGYVKAYSKWKPILAAYFLSSKMSL